MKLLDKVKIFFLWIGKYFALERKKGNNYGRTKNPPLIIMSNGDVEDFDPVVIEAARKEVAERTGFFEKHCLPLGDNRCHVCKMGSCPISDQG